MRHFLLPMLCVAGLSTSAPGQLMVPDVTNHRIMLFDEVDGGLVDPSFVDMSGLGGNPVSAVRIGEEIWVSNQTNRTIHRFDLDGAHLGDVAGEMDYVRGFAVVGDTVYAANAGQNTGHPERTGVLVIDVPSASVTGRFDSGSDGQGFGFDVLAFAGPDGPALLVPDQSSTDEGLEDGEDLDRFRPDGSFAGTFHDSDGITGIDNPMQLARTASGSTIAAGFTGPLFGIFEYDDDGAQIDFHFIPDTNVYGVHPLDNGRILFTTFNGVFVLDPGNPDPSTNVETMLAGVWAGFIEPLAGDDLDGEAGCPGDVDASDHVGMDDLLAVLSLWGPCGPGCPADMNGDGGVDLTDVLAVLAAWGPCP